MAVALGTVTTYGLTEGVPISIDPFLQMLSPTETPLQNGRGSDGRLVLGSSPVDQKKFEWQDDSIDTPRSTLAATVTTGGLVLTVASGEQHRFGTGHVLMVGDEQMRVTGYPGTDQLTVTRAFNATTAGTLASAAQVLDLGTFITEGSDPDAARSSDWNNRYNMVQVLGPDQMAVSGTENIIRKYGLNMSMLDYQAAKRLIAMTISFEQSLIYGVRLEDSSAGWRQTGGIKWHITNNGTVNSAGGAITEARIVDMQQSLYDVGGSPNIAMLTATQKRKISALDSSSIRLGRQDNGRGQIVDYIDSDFGRMDFLVNRWCLNSDIFMFKSGQAKIRVLRPMQLEALAKTGDSRKAQLVGEKGLQFNAASHAGQFTGLT
tara:strand:- start:1551 stop:2678 length:1128 start_codon:yes stop_codon:yes gene_type:complete